MIYIMNFVFCNVWKFKSYIEIEYFLNIIYFSEVIKVIRLKISWMIWYFNLELYFKSLEERNEKILNSMDSVLM